MACDSPLLIDLYQLTMMQAYLDRGLTQTAVFEFFVRKLPPRRGFLVAAGLEQALDFLEGFRFSDEDIAWLAETGRFDTGFAERLQATRFTGDVHAMPEGTVFFPNEPILRVTAPLPEAQLVETRLINILHFQTLIASKAARFRIVAPDKLLVDFGLRRAHGAEAGLFAARASYLAGFDGTATLLAEKRFGIPTFGTMAHSFIQAYDDESDAFEDFALSRPRDVTLLIDTYDTEAAARKIVSLAPRFKARGIAVRAVRIDSGDLAKLSRGVRAILDTGGLSDVKIMASGGLDEEAVARLLRDRAPIDGFGIGTSLTTSADAPALDCAYKLQQYAGIGRRKHSEGKATWPGAKQVWRGYEADGRMAGDILSLESDRPPGRPLLERVMHAGRRTASSPPLARVREYAARELRCLPEAMRRLDPAPNDPVTIADALVVLTEAVDAQLKTGGPHHE